MMQMANENLKAQKVYGKYIKDLPQVTEVNDTDDIIIEDSTPITSRVKLGVLFDSIKKRITSTWKFTELNNQTIVEYTSELNEKYANNARFIPFTMTPTGANNSSALITNITKINSLFGVTDASTRNSGAIIMNGDGNADSLHAEGVTWQGDNLYAVFNKNVNGRFRITGLLYYTPASFITLS